MGSVGDSGAGWVRMMVCVVWVASFRGLKRFGLGEYSCGFEYSSIAPIGQFWNARLRIACLLWRLASAVVLIAWPRYGVGLPVAAVVSGNALSQALDLCELLVLDFKTAQLELRY